MRGRQAGFTLLEILVALAILGFILLGLGQGLRFGLTAFSTQTRSIASRDEISAAERLLRALIERMEPTEPGEIATMQGLPGAMRFRTQLPVSAEILNMRRADVGLGVDGERRLVLRLMPDPRAGRGGVITESLLGGVDHIELFYWRPAAIGIEAGWVRNWNTSDLPVLVRIRIVFSPGDGRHWPDIVAAPLRLPLSNS